MNIYNNCPKFDNGKFVLRLIESNDAADLLKVYSDTIAVPLFNSDNCHGDDFYYTTIERMQQAVDFWLEAYKNGWFVRWSVVDKMTNEVVGSIEAFRRDSEDYFTNCGLLRLDLRSDYEKPEKIIDILTEIVHLSFEMFGCDKVATKAISVAAERRKALVDLGFALSREKLIGFDGTEYCDYFVLHK